MTRFTLILFSIPDVETSYYSENDLRNLFNVESRQKIWFAGLGDGQSLNGKLSLDNKVAIQAVLGEKIPIVLDNKFYHTSLKGASINSRRSPANRCLKKTKYPLCKFNIVMGQSRDRQLITFEKFCSYDIVNLSPINSAANYFSG